MIPEAGLLHDEFLAAIDDLRNHARLQPRTTVVEGAEAEASLHESLSALQELFDSIGDYLQQVLPPLGPHISRDAIRAFILETRRELDELKACRTVGNMYVECLTITEADDGAIDLEVEGSLRLRCGWPQMLLRCSLGRR